MHSPSCITHSGWKLTIAIHCHQLQDRYTNNNKLVIKFIDFSPLKINSDIFIYNFSQTLSNVGSHYRKFDNELPFFQASTVNEALADLILLDLC